MSKKSNLPAVVGNSTGEVMRRMMEVADPPGDDVMLSLAEYRRTTGYAIMSSPKDIPSMAKANGARFYKLMVYPKWFLDLLAEIEQEPAP